LSSDKLVILAVSFKDSAETVKEFIDSNGLTFSILLDSEGKVDAQYQSPVFPTTCFVDCEGIVKFIKEGRSSSL